MLWDRNPFVRIVLGLIVAGLVGTAHGPALSQGTEGLPSFPWNLETCLSLARQGNLDLAQAEASARFARGTYQRTFAYYLPDISAGVSYRQNIVDFSRGFYDASSGRFVPPGRDVDDYWTVSGNLSQSLVDVEAAYNIKGSGLRKKSAEMAFEASKEQLELDVTQSYYDLLKSLRTARVAEEAVELAKEQLRRTESLYQLGSVPRADVLQSRVNLARNELELISARRSVRDDRAELALVLGLPSEVEIEIDTTLVLPPLDAAWDEDQLWLWAVEDRADLVEVKLASRAADHESRAAWWSRWPTITAQAYYSKQSDIRGEVLENFTSDARWGFVVSLNVNLNPLDMFILGNTVGNVEQAKWTALQERRRFQKKELDVRLDIRRALLAWEEAHERLGMAQENVRYAQENLRLQRALYEAGGGTILEWNNAQVELTRARNELLQAEVDILAALASLERSVGRPLG